MCKNLTRTLLLCLCIVANLCFAGSVVGQQVGTALSFDGVDDHVSLRSSVVNLTRFTIEAWVKPTANSGTIYSEGLSTSNSPLFSIIHSKNGNNGFAIEFKNPAGIGLGVSTTNGALPLNQWSHIAFVRTSATTAQLYINGRLTDDFTFADPGTIQADTANFGVRRGSNEDYFFTGSMDEARIWSRALCQAEIQNNKDCELNAAGQNGLLSLYHFNQGIAGGTNLNRKWILAIPNAEFGLYFDPLTGLIVESDGSELDPYTFQTVLPPNPSIPVVYLSAFDVFLTYNPDNEALTTLRFTTVDLGTRREYAFSGFGVRYLLGQIYYITTKGELVLVEDDQNLLDPVSLSVISSGEPWSLLPTPAFFCQALNPDGPPPSYSNYEAAYGTFETPALTDETGHNNGTLHRFLLAGTVSNWATGNASGNCAVFTPATEAITGSPSVCVNSTTTLSNALAGGVWSSANTAVATVNASGVVSALTAGTSVITYTNLCGGVSTFTITANAAPTARITAGGATAFCPGGQVVLTASAATSYLWSNNETTQSITVTAAGDYSVTVTNENGCQATSAATHITVGAMATPTITAGGPTTFCEGGQVVLSAPAGNAYLWSNHETTQSITVHASGNYSVTITDANGCSATSAATGITVNPITTPTITTDGSTTFCTGGSVTLTASAGNSYLWSNNATTQSITVNASGNYSVTVTNVNGCSATSAATVVTVNALPIATITAGGATTFCSGGQVVLTASAGSSYLWSNNATTQSITVNTSGNYSVKVTNANNCSATSAATGVTVYPITTPTIMAGGAITFCTGGSVTLTTSAGSSYLWSNNATTQSITVNAAGNYSVSVTNANGCSVASAATTVTVSAVPTVAAITGMKNVCAGSTTQLNNATGGGVWSSTNIAAATVDASGLVTGVANGTSLIKYTVTNAGGCVASASLNVTVNALPIITIAPLSAVVCAGTSVTLAANSGGGNAMRFNGTNSSVDMGTGVILPQTFTQEAWIYSGSGNDGLFHGFLGNQSTAINQRSPSLWIHDGNSIHGGFATGSNFYYYITGNVIAQNTWNHIAQTYDGTTLKVYVNGVQITTLPTNLQPPVNSVPVATGVRFIGRVDNFFKGDVDEVRLWNVTRTAAQIRYDMNLAVAPDTTGLVGYYKFSENPGSTTTADATAGARTGTLVNGATLVTSSAPVGASITWSPSAGLNTTAGAIAIATPTTTTTYIATATDPVTGCVSTASSVVTVNPLPTATVSGGMNVCQNTASPNITFTGANGTAPYTFTYTINSGAQQTVVSSGNAATVAVPTGVVGTLTYALVSVRDGGASACTNTASGSTVMIVRLIPVISSVSGNTSICSGTATKLTATSSNAGKPTFRWYDAASGGALLFTGASYTTPALTATTTYHVEVSDIPIGCTSTARTAVTVIVNALATATISAEGPTTFCAGGSVVLTASAGSSYLWSNNETTQSITATETGNYSVTVTNANNCSAISAVTSVTVNALPTAITAKTDVNCLGGSNGSIIVTGSDGNAPYQYSIDGGSNYQGSNVFAGLTAGSYTILVKSATNCLSASQQVIIGTVPDVTKPVPNIANLPLLTGECAVTVTNIPTATDNCVGNVTGTTTDPLSYTSQGMYTIKWTYDDHNGNISTQTQTVIVDDVTAPVADITALPNITGECSARVIAAPTATDNCKGTVTATTNDPLTYSAQGTYIITWTYDDGNGNTSTQIQRVIVDDVTAPVADITVLPNITGECSAKVITAPTATDNCKGTVTATTYDPLTYSAEGMYTITWVYDDGNGNTSTQTQTVIVDDVTAPVADITALPNITGECSARVIAAPTATDNCKGTVTAITNDPLTYSAQGTYTITWVYDDGNGNTSTQMQTVIVDDVTAPVADITELPIITGECSVKVITAPTATDNCKGTITATTADPLAYSAQGTYTIKWTYDDGNGNTSTQTQTVIVRDVTPPTIICQSNIIATATSVAGAVITYPTPVAADNCSVTTVALTAGLPSGSTFPIGITTVTYTVTDVAGLTASCSFDVTVSGLAPMINCPANISVSSTADLCGEIVNFVATETRAVPASTITYSIAPGSFFPVGTTTVTAIATNAVGVSACSFTVTVTDNQFPVLIGVPANNTVECNAIPAPATVTATDNCSTSVPSFTETKVDGSCTNSYTLIRTWSTADASGNTTTASQVITVQDTQAPVLSAAPANTTVECNEVPTAAILTATDNCATPTVVYTQTSTQNASPTNVGYYNYTLTRTWTATDACGNTSSKTQVITVQDTQKPVVVCPVVAASCNNQTGNSKTVTLTATDNCGPVTVTYNLTGATVLAGGTGSTLTKNFNLGTTQINWTVKDVTGNTSTCSTTVVINALPVASITAASVDVFCNNFVLTGNSTLNGPFTYQWLFNNQINCSTQQLTLGITNPDGVYTLYTTDGNGCRSTVGATYNYQKQNLVNSYTILTYKDASIGKYNKVLSGSIGVMTSKGDADFKSYSAVTGAGSFVKAPDIDKNGSGIVINSQIIGIATPTLPAMLYNTASTKYLPDYTVSQYATVTINGNYDKLTVRKGANVTVTGNTFGTINVEYGASIKFTNANLNIESLLVDDGAKDNYYSYIRFAPNTAAKISNKVSIGSQVRLNPENNKVTIYMGDQKSDEEKFTVKGGDTKVIANVMMPNGKLRVTATDSDDDHDNCDHRSHNSWSCKHRSHVHNSCNHGAHNASDCKDDVYMTGLFIVESLDSKGNTVIWNNYDCASPSTNIVLNTAKPPVQTATSETLAPVKAEVVVTEEELKVTVMPNPSTTFFTLKLESKYETPVTMRVMDAQGRVVDARSKMGANSTIQIGHNYSSGTYYAELIQGTKRKVVQLIKAKG